MLGNGGYNIQATLAAPSKAATQPLTMTMQRIKAGVPANCSSPSHLPAQIYRFIIPAVGWKSANTTHTSMEDAQRSIW